MTSRTPFRSLTPFLRRALRDEPENLWRRFFGAEEQGATTWAPRVDIVDQPQAYIVRAELPGMKPEDVQVQVTGDVLTLRGERKHETKRDNEHWHVTERRYGAFERTIAFPTAVNAQNVEAELEKGVLTVRLMKREEGKGAKIEVRAG